MGPPDLCLPDTQWTVPRIRFNPAVADHHRIFAGLFEAIKPEIRVFARVKRNAAGLALAFGTTRIPAGRSDRRHDSFHSALRTAPLNLQLGRFGALGLNPTSWRRGSSSPVEAPARADVVRLGDAR
ncbi:MAG: hypothetical protein IPK82_11205 [Polyangiaceae bacterium]|nr:hypothetical protein [Polyangiaceae bacterium]